MQTKDRAYIKHQSFDDFYSSIDSDPEAEKQRIISLLKNKLAKRCWADILNRALTDLSGDSNNPQFKITKHIADELSKLNDKQLPRYVYHRYRYDVFPKTKELDQFPPYLQIEPTSICNYRCVFCFQTDNDFTAKANGFMGNMSLNLFKNIIDQSQDNIEFFSLASRGEPFLCKEINQMLEYCEGKFLGLKVNTNASMLNEAHCHALLSGGVNTVVFSADAASEPLYSKLRVKGNLNKVLKNIRLFLSIKEQHYPKSKIITRVSGVKYDDHQDMQEMIRLWSDLVDQVSFVAYNPWENIYQSNVNSIIEPCSDLFRRMFVWYDGTVNPCDTDYRSTLSVGKTDGNSIAEFWHSPDYERLRNKHLNGKRQSLEPCRRCSVV